MGRRDSSILIFYLYTPDRAGGLKACLPQEVVVVKERVVVARNPQYVTVGCEIETRSGTKCKRKATYTVLNGHKSVFACAQHLDRAKEMA